MDVCQLCVTLLCEITDKEMVESNPEAVKKCLDQLTENSVWVLLLKVCMLAETEKEQKGEISQGEEDLLVQKCLTLLDNMRDLAPTVISNKILHSDNVIDYLLENIEREDQSPSISAMSSELVSNIIQSCGEDFRTKFVLTLAGMARLLAVVDKRQANGDKDVLLNVFDTLAALLVGNKEHAQEFRRRGGYAIMRNVLVEVKELRNDALKVLSFAFTLYGDEKDIASQLEVDDVNQVVGCPCTSLRHCGAFPSPHVMPVMSSTKKCRHTHLNV